MDNVEIAEAAGLTWRFVTDAQVNVTYQPDREQVADQAELYTETGRLLLAMRRIPAMRTAFRALPAFWAPFFSDLLTKTALDRVPYVDTIGQLDLGDLLDYEIEDARLPDQHVRVS